MSKEERDQQLEHIKNEIMDLKESPLYKYRIEHNNHPVIGEGNHAADIMFIGEAPGKNEAETGRPFCGRSGVVLDELLKSIGLLRENVYITNIVKDRPPENRDPFPEEIELYGPYLDRQIDIIKPKVIATLGRFSMSYIMKKFGVGNVDLSIGKLHGKTFETETSFGTLTIIPLYHPAVAIYNSNKIDELKNDFSVLKKWL